MTRLSVQAGMDFAALPAGHKLHPVIASAMGTGRVASASASASSTPSASTAAAAWAPWDASYFGLERSTLFRNAPPEAKEAVVATAGRGLLEEAYFIEKSGIAFAAKMVLLAQTIDERMLYALFGADEATHFSAVRRFLPNPPEAPTKNPFLDLLARTIETADQATLQFVIQVVLEGWGLRHYRELRDGCQDEALRGVLDGILADEAAHHGSGRLLFEASGPSASVDDAIIETLTPLLRMVQAGPQGVIAAMESALGPLSDAERRTLFDELDGAGHAAARLSHLKSLMRGERARSIVAALDGRRAFDSLAPEEWA